MIGGSSPSRRRRRYRHRRRRRHRHRHRRRRGWRRRQRYHRRRRQRRRRRRRRRHHRRHHRRRCRLNAQKGERARGGSECSHFFPYEQSVWYVVCVLTFQTPCCWALRVLILG